MKQQIKISQLKRGEIKKFKLFIYKNHKKNHIFAKKISVLDWYYGDKKKYNFYIAKIKNKIIGVQGFIPFEKFDRKIKNIIFLAYWRVIKSSNIATGLRLFKKISFKKKFIGVLGIENNLLQYHKWQGFKIGKLNHHFFINNSKINFKFLKRKIKKQNFLKKNIDVYNINKKNIAHLVNKKIFFYQYPIKSKKYLLQRYLNNPFYKYKINLLKKENFELIVIFRIIKRNNYKLIKLIDIIGKQENFKFIGKYISNILKQYNAEYLDFYSYGINKKYLKSAGFINRYISSITIPDHFEPFENKNIDINFAYKTSKVIKNIRLCKGDGDMDRPSRIK